MLKMFFQMNAMLRFSLEVVAIIYIGKYGYHIGESWEKWLLAIALPLATMSIWGVFNVPNDPSRSGKAPIITRGWVRLIIEWSVFGFGCFAIYTLNNKYYAFLFIGLVTIHYLCSYSRIKWLLER